MTSAAKSGLVDAPVIVDAAIRRSAIERARAQKLVLPTFAQLSWRSADSRTHRGATAGRRSRRSAGRQSVARALAQRARPASPNRRSRPYRAAQSADRRQGADHRDDRIALPDDRRAQGAAGLCRPRYAARHRRLRSRAPSRGLAIDRQLLPRRRGDLPHSRLRRRRRAARGHEPRTLRMAGAVGQRSLAHHSHSRAPKATSRRSTTSAANSPPRRTTSSSTSSPRSRTIMAHYVCTGAACGDVFDHLAASRQGLRLAAFVAATGSAGTIAAGDYLKTRYGSAHRRGRSAGMSDHARERLWRTQHPGDRRQAHPADPQCDEHRRRDRGLRPRHRPAQPDVQFAGGPGISGVAEGSRSGSRRHVRRDRHFRASPTSSLRSSSREPRGSAATTPS